MQKREKINDQKSDYAISSYGMYKMALFNSYHQLKEWITLPYKFLQGSV